MVVDLLLEASVAVGNGVLCSVVVRVGAGIASVVWITPVSVVWITVYR